MTKANSNFVSTIALLLKRAGRPWGGASGLRREALILAGMALTIGTAGTAHAIPFEVDTPGGSFTLGTGWGSTGDGDLNQLLNVDWALDASLAGHNFDLNNVNDMHTFAFGTGFLLEEVKTGAGTARLCDGVTVAGECDGANTNEFDNLGLTANLMMLLPNAETILNIGIVGTVVGNLSDGDVDLTVIFDPVTVGFGVGGKYSVDLSDLSFTGNEQTKPISAKFTLLQLPETGGQAIPEPGTMALFAFGLAGIAFMRRRRSA